MGLEWLLKRSRAAPLTLQTQGPPYPGSQATNGMLVLRRRMPVLSKQQQLLIELPVPHSYLNPRRYTQSNPLQLPPRYATPFTSPVYELVTTRGMASVNQLHTTVDRKCPSCGEEPQTVEHWLQRCPNTVALSTHRSRFIPTRTAC